MPSEFGEWLKAELAKRGWSMRQLALRSAIDPASVTNVVCSGATPRMESILKIPPRGGLGEDPALRAAKRRDLGLNRSV